jgi:hypothetical protein
VSSDRPEPGRTLFPTARRVLRWRRWRAIACVLLAIVIAGGVVDGVATLYYGARVKTRLEALRAAGKPLLGRDIAPKPVPPNDNAAPLYLAVDEIVKLHNPGRTNGNAPTEQPVDVPREEVGYSRYNWNDPEDLAVLARYVQKDQRALDLLRDATSRPAAVFDVDWDQGLETLLPHYAKLRLVSRFVAAAAVVAAHQGNQAEALDRVRMGFVVARHTSGDPALIGQFVANSADSIMRRAAEYVLAQGPVPEEAARRLAEELQRVDYPQRYVVAMQTERVLGLDAFSRAKRGQDVQALVGDEGPGGSWLEGLYVWAYPGLLRPVLYADELQYLRYMDELERRGSLPLRGRATARTPEDGRPLAPHWAIITRLVVPPVSRADLRLESALAQRRLLQTALGLQVYRQRYGRYPSALAELRAMGWVVPTDNFTGQDFLYRRRGAGYLLYSVGPNLKDDGGQPHWLQLPKEEGGTPRHEPPPITAAGDFVWPEPGVPQPWGFAR